jgi:hypothetical protein
MKTFLEILKEVYISSHKPSKKTFEELLADVAKEDEEQKKRSERSFEDLFAVAKKEEDDKTVKHNLAFNIMKKENRKGFSELESLGYFKTRRDFTIKDVIKDPAKIIDIWLKELLREQRFYKDDEMINTTVDDYNYSDYINRNEEKKDNSKRNAEYYLNSGEKRTRPIKRKEIITNRDEILAQIIINIYASGNLYVDTDLREKLAQFYDSDHRN